MKRHLCFFLIAGGLVAGLAPLIVQTRAQEQPVKEPGQLESLDWQLPNEKLELPFEKRVPIVFVNQSKNIREWIKLPKFWNEASEESINPATGEKVTRKVVKIKLPMGLTQDPPVPPGNEMTVERWILGKKLYFDPILSSDGSVACASCHDPKRGWTDQSPFSTGIFGHKGPISAPTVLNSAYNDFQFWDGRAFSLEHQAQGPVANPLEMFSNKGDAWRDAVKRVRKQKAYLEGFRKAYGVEPTRDTIVKAIGVFERTVLSGNSIHDRADFAMRLRVADEGGTEFKLQPKDYEKVLNEAIKAGDRPALAALGINLAQQKKVNVPALAKSINNGRVLFFNKARCNSCHVGHNFTDNSFHNLGVGVKNGQLPKDGLGRYAVQMTGHKDPDMVGAFKTPTLRGLVSTAPYMHDGNEKTLEEVIEFYDKGGNANRYLSNKMRDLEAEQAYVKAKRSGQKYTGPKVHIFGPDQTPIVPRELKLTDQEKKDLVLFLRALEGDPVDPIVSDPNTMPPILSAR